MRRAGEDAWTDTPEGTRLRTARVLEALVRLNGALHEENVLLRATIDRRLGVLEHRLLGRPDVVADELTREARRRRRPARPETVVCACGATFTRRNVRKVRCDACTHEARIQLNATWNAKVRAIRAHLSSTGTDGSLDP